MNANDLFCFLSHKIMSPSDIGDSYMLEISNKQICQSTVQLSESFHKWTRCFQERWAIKDIRSSVFFFQPLAFVFSSCYEFVHSPAHFVNSLHLYRQTCNIHYHLAYLFQLHSSDWLVIQPHVSFSSALEWFAKPQTSIPYFLSLFYLSLFYHSASN